MDYAIKSPTVLQAADFFILTESVSPSLGLGPVPGKEVFHEAPPSPSKIDVPPLLAKMRSPRSLFASGFPDHFFIGRLQEGEIVPTGERGAPPFRRSTILLLVSLSVDSFMYEKSRHPFFGCSSTPVSFNPIQTLSTVIRLRVTLSMRLTTFPYFRISRATRYLGFSRSLELVGCRGFFAPENDVPQPSIYQPPSSGPFFSSSRFSLP